jgi:hypothetical protein
MPRIWNLNLPEMFVLFLGFGLPIWVTVLVIRKKGITQTNQLLFLLLTWLVPIIGPIVTLVLMNQSKTAQ